MRLVNTLISLRVYANVLLCWIVTDGFRRSFSSHWAKEFPDPAWGGASLNRCPPRFPEPAPSARGSSWSLIVSYLIPSLWTEAPFLPIWQITGACGEFRLSRWRLDVQATVFAQSRLILPRVAVIRRIPDGSVCHLSIRAIGRLKSDYPQRYQGLSPFLV